MTLVIGYIDINSVSSCLNLHTDVCLFEIPTACFQLNSVLLRLKLKPGDFVLTFRSLVLKN